MIGENSYKYLTVDEMKSLGDDSMPIDVTHDEKQHTTQVTIGIHHAQCCQIWQYIENLATFHLKLLLKFWVGYLPILITFLATLKKIGLKRVYISSQNPLFWCVLHRGSEINIASSFFFLFLC